MGREFELKFRATPELLSRIMEAWPGEYTDLNMLTTYFDTPDMDFSSRRWTLRRRMENQRSVCTLKTPADGLGRNEWELECDSIQEAIPILAAQSGWAELEALAQKGLDVSCGARFTRRCRILELGSTKAELALDQGVLIGGGRVRDFAEVELELKEGCEETLLLFARKLQGDFALETEHASKFARAKALAQEG